MPFVPTLLAISPKHHTTMAANNRRLSFIDPYHLLMKKDYEGGQCDICLLELAGFDGYGCDSCNIHIHRTCADCFGETTSFSANQSSLTFKLSRSPPHVGRISCTSAGGVAPQGPSCTTAPATVTICTLFAQSSRREPVALPLSIKAMTSSWSIHPATPARPAVILCPCGTTPAAAAVP